MTVEYKSPTDGVIVGELKCFSKVELIPTTEFCNSGNVFFFQMLIMCISNQLIDGDTGLRLLHCMILPHQVMMRVHGTSGLNDVNKKFNVTRLRTCRKRWRNYAIMTKNNVIAPTIRLAAIR